MPEGKIPGEKMPWEMPQREMPQEDNPLAGTADKQAPAGLSWADVIGAGDSKEGDKK